jgi:hypothetical protein
MKKTRATQTPFFLGGRLLPLFLLLSSSLQPPLCYVSFVMFTTLLFFGRRRRKEEARGKRSLTTHNHPTPILHRPTPAPALDICILPPALCLACIYDAVRHKRDGWNRGPSPNPKSLTEPRPSYVQSDGGPTTASFLHHIPSHFSTPSPPHPHRFGRSESYPYVQKRAGPAPSLLLPSPPPPPASSLESYSSFEM